MNLFQACYAYVHAAEVSAAIPRLGSTDVVRDAATTVILHYAQRYYYPNRTRSKQDCEELAAALLVKIVKKLGDTKPLYLRIIAREADTAKYISMLSAEWVFSVDPGVLDLLGAIVPYFNTMALNAQRDFYKKRNRARLVVGQIAGGQLADEELGEDSLDMSWLLPELVEAARLTLEAANPTDRERADLERLIEAHMNEDASHSKQVIVELRKEHPTLPAVQALESTITILQGVVHALERFRKANRQLFVLLDGLVESPAWHVARELRQTIGSTESADREAFAVLHSPLTSLIEALEVLLRADRKKQIPEARRVRNRLDKRYSRLRGRLEDQIAVWEVANPPQVPATLPLLARVALYHLLTSAVATANRGAQAQALHDLGQYLSTAGVSTPMSQNPRTAPSAQSNEPVWGCNTPATKSAKGLTHGGNAVTTTSRDVLNYLKSTQGGLLLAPPADISRYVTIKWLEHDGDPWLVIDPKTARVQSLVGAELEQEFVVLGDGGQAILATPEGTLSFDYRAGHLEVVQTGRLPQQQIASAPEVLALLAGISTAGWVLENVQEDWKSLGFVARLWEPQKYSDVTPEQAFDLQRAFVAHAQTLPGEDARAIEARALGMIDVFYEGLIGDASSQELVESREELACLAWVLEAKGLMLVPEKLKKLDNDVLARPGRFEQVADTDRLSAVRQQEPDSWWGVLGGDL